MHTQSNLHLEIPHNPAFKPPLTKQEFEAMSYQARAQLQTEYPDLYWKFTAPRTW